MKRMLSLLLVCVLALTGGCSHPVQAQQLTAREITVSPAASPQVSGALSAFGLHLLQSARQEQKEGSVLLSPLSVALALSMAANGAQGETLAAFEQVFGSGASLDELNAACAQLMEDYTNPGGSTQSSIANSVWVDPEGQIREDFIGKCAGIFDAQVFQEDLSAPDIVDKLNGWVSGHTKGMIPHIVSKPFDENAAALLVNALYLKNTWDTEFDPLDTCPRDFTHQDGSVERQDFLNHHSLSFPYLTGEGCEGVLLPYDDGRLGFFALMPGAYPDAPDFDDWLSSLEGEELSELILSGDESEFLTLGLPKFEQEWNGTLQDSLSALGLERAFDPDAADFSLLGDDPYGYYLSQVIHAAKIEVNEKGTEAAAATVVEAASGSAAPVDGLTLIFDRPFLYGIVDLKNGVPLFLGTFE